MNVLDLFSGIGGFSLGLERAGMRTVAFCEIEKYCRQVLAKHWPGVPIYEDIRRLTAERLRADGIGPVDLVCGGFPCQDISISGHQKGIFAARSGLWKEQVRIIGELRPKAAIVENVAELLRNQWLGRVLGDLAEIRFDAQWHCIRKSRFGLPSHRDRVWIIAYPNGSKLEGLDLSKSILFDPEESCRRELARAVDACIPADDYTRMRPNHTGVSGIMAELQAYGNSVTPEIPEMIGRAIMAIEFSRDRTGAGLSK